MMSRSLACVINAVGLALAAYGFERGVPAWLLAVGALAFIVAWSALPAVASAFERTAARWISIAALVMSPFLVLSLAYQEVAAFALVPCVIATTWIERTSRRSVADRDHRIGHVAMPCLGAAIVQHVQEPTGRARTPP